MDAVNDRVVQSILSALDGVALRQQVTAHNIANASTPGFRAQQVDFESSLASAIARGEPTSARPDVSLANTPVKQDGNSVDMTREMTTMSEAGLHFDALIAAMNFKMNVVRSALAR